SGHAGDTSTLAVTAIPCPYTVTVIFPYTTLIRSDTITAYADTNTNNTQDADEPSDGDTQAWVLPPTTVTINQAAGQADPTSTAPITFTAVFSEDRKSVA